MEEAVKQLGQVDLNSILHSQEISYACHTTRLASGVIQLVQDYLTNHANCENLVCVLFLEPIQGTVTELWG